MSREARDRFRIARIGGAFVLCASLLVAAPLGAAAGDPLRGLGSPGALGAPSAVGPGPTLWAWVVARQATASEYTPSVKNQGNSAGGTNTVTRMFTGSYVVTFADLWPGSCTTRGCGGNFQVSALSSTQRVCNVIDWALGPGDAPSDIRVDVACRDRTGAAEDSAFSLNWFSARDGAGTVAYVFNNDETSAGYEPRFEYSYDPSSAINEVSRTAIGMWTVYLPAVHAGTGGDLQLSTTYGSCRLTGRSDQPTYSLVMVRCLDFGGDSADSHFSLAFTNEVGLKGKASGAASYVFANKPMSPSYRPAAAFRYSSAGATPTITRSATGVYVAKLPGMPTGGSAQVTAFGTGKSECQLASIRTDGTPQRIGVRCFRPNGDPVDSQFYLTYAR